MTNPILLVAYNGLEMTKEAVASALAQTIPVGLLLVVNGSNDGTHEWAIEEQQREPRIGTLFLEHNYPVVQVFNRFAAELFKSSPHFLAIPNDVVLHPTTYEEYLKWPRGLVTGSEIKDRTVYENYIQSLPPTQAVSENTPMAVMLTRKWVWDAVIAKDGYFFDEGYFHYASDCDLALRVASCGIRGVQLNTPYYHVGSATHNLAEIHAESSRKADDDRAYFVKKWGFRVDSLEYGQRPNDPNFRG